MTPRFFLWSLRETFGIEIGIYVSLQPFIGSILIYKALLTLELISAPAIRIGDFSEVGLMPDEDQNELPDRRILIRPRVDFQLVF